MVMAVTLMVFSESPGGNEVFVVKEVLVKRGAVLMAEGGGDGLVSVLEVVMGRCSCVMEVIIK